MLLGEIDPLVPYFSKPKPEVPYWRTLKYNNINFFYNKSLLWLQIEVNCRSLGIKQMKKWRNLISYCCIYSEKNGSLVLLLSVETKRERYFRTSFSCYFVICLFCFQSVICGTIGKWGLVIKFKQKMGVISVIWTGKI